MEDESEYIPHPDQEPPADPAENTIIDQVQAAILETLQGFPLDTIEVDLKEVAGASQEDLLRAADFSKLSYGTNEAKLRATGFPTRAELEAEGYHLEFLSEPDTDTHCVILTKNDSDQAWLAFRGTKTKENIKTDLRINVTEMPGVGKVHRGFYTAYTSIKPQVDAALARHAEAGKDKIHITGHSLGGALATLAAVDLAQEGKNIDQVTTFGSPRVLSSSAAQTYHALGLNECTLRLSQQRDPVPQAVPRQLGYRHIGVHVDLPRVKEAPLHKMKGYRQGAQALKDDKIPLSSISFFYLPKKFIQYLVQTVQKLFSKTKAIEGDTSIKPTPTPGDRDRNRGSGQSKL